MRTACLTGTSSLAVCRCSSATYQARSSSWRIRSVGFFRKGKRTHTGSLFAQQFRIPLYDGTVTQTVHSSMAADGFRVSEDGSMGGWLEVLSVDYQTPLPATTIRQLTESLSAAAAGASHGHGHTSFNCMMAMFDHEYAGEVGSNGRAAAHSNNNKATLRATMTASPRPALTASTSSARFHAPLSFPTFVHCASMQTLCRASGVRYGWPTFLVKRRDERT